MRPSHISCILRRSSLAVICSLLSQASVSSGTTSYVTPSGAGSYSGVDWDNAYGSIQQAVDARTGAGDFIFLKSGAYSNSSAIGITNYPDLTIAGGFLGDGGTSTNLDTNATIVTRNLAVTNRIFDCYASTVTFQRMVVNNGLSAQGGGFSLVSCRTVISNCAIRNNLTPNASAMGGKGGGIYATGNSLVIIDSDLSGNAGRYLGGASSSGYGGAIWASSLALTLRNCTVSSNWANSTGQGGWYCYGGALYLTGVNSLIEGCSFNANYGDAAGRGGAIYSDGAGAMVLTNCVFTRNYVTGGGPSGGALNLSGSQAGQVYNCQFLRNTNAASVEDIYLGTSGQVVMRDNVIGLGTARGINKAGSGALAMTNCLIYGQPGGGILVANGAITIANATIANNNGWGLFNSSTSAQSVVDSIFWDNASGGFTGGTINATYTDSQETHAGAGNLSADPLFVGGYYLSTNGLAGQTDSSPCIDAGHAAASALGLDAATTRTDGAGDQDAVDLGYHYTNGIPDAVISNRLLYVDIVNGNNANTGWTPDNALSNISYALSAKAVDGTTLNIATGNYTTSAGETFPLMPGVLNVTLRGTNRSATIINAGGVDKCFSATYMGNIWLEGLTFTNGKSATGAGLYLVNCRTVITNCVVRNNITPTTGGNGGGIYAAGYTLGVYNSEIANNAAKYSGGASTHVYGGGIYANSLALKLQGCTIATNWANSTGQFGYYGFGGGLYLTSVKGVVDDCSFTANRGTASGKGGAIYADGFSVLTVTNCAFGGNYVSGGAGTAGGVLNLAGAVTGQVWNCQFLNNSNAASAEDVNIDTAGQVTMRNIVIAHGSSAGIAKAGNGSLSVLNGLIYGEPGHGISITATSGVAAIVNTTIADNGGWGITNLSGTATVANCIAWGNFLGGMRGCTVDFSDSQEALGGSHNLNQDPDFVWPATNNYRLKRRSLCINAGTNQAWMFEALDLDGGRRIMMGAVDMGPYENPAVFGTSFVVR